MTYVKRNIPAECRSSLNEIIPTFINKTVVAMVTLYSERFDKTTMQIETPIPKSRTGPTVYKHSTRQVAIMGCSPRYWGGGFLICILTHINSFMLFFFIENEGAELF